MRYRNKAIEIEAFQYDGDLMNSKGEYYVPDWAVKSYEKNILFYGTDGELFVKSLGEIYYIAMGDYVIRGIEGELYPCNPKIFERTYEPIIVF